MLIYANLNFDNVGLVSRFLVVGILHNQNDNSASATPVSAAAAASNSPSNQSNPITSNF